MAELNTNNEKGTLLMTRALEKYAQGDFEGGDKDREKANKYFDLAKMEINAEADNISQLYGENRNFGIAFKVLESNLSNSFNDSSISKKPLMEAFKKVKRNKSLNEQFKVFNAFTNPQNVVNPEEYVNEIIGLSNIYEQKDLNTVNEKLIKFIQSNNINELIHINDEDIELFESINYVLTNKKGFNNINEFLKHKNNIVEYVTKHNSMCNENKNIDDVLNENIDILEEKYNSILNDDEKELIKMNAYSHESKEKIFNENKKSLLKLIENKIKTVSDSTKTQWIDLKEKINESSYDKTTFLIDLSKIIEIHNKLS